MQQQSQEDRERERWDSVSKEDEAEEYSTPTEAIGETEAQDLLFHHRKGK